MFIYSISRTFLATISRLWSVAFTVSFPYSTTTCSGAPGETTPWAPVAVHWNNLLIFRAASREAFSLFNRVPYAHFSPEFGCWIIACSSTELVAAFGLTSAPVTPRSPITVQRIIGASYCVAIQFNSCISLTVTTLILWSWIIT